MARSRGVYNQIYNDEDWEKVNDKNKAVILDFMAELKQQKKSAGTISGYRQDLKVVMIYILGCLDNKYILDLNRKDFRNMSIWFSDDCKMSSSRVNRLKSSINSMLSFCEDDDSYNYEINYAKKVKGIPKERVKTNEEDFFFSFDEFIKVRDKLIKSGDLQTAVFWSISFDSAGRKGEIYQIKKTDLENSNKTNIVRGKRGKLFPLVYLDDTRELIKKYLEQRGDDKIESLWYKETSTGGKEEITVNSLYYRMIKCSNILSDIRGKECNIFPHTSRHSRIECLVKGEDDRLKNPDGTNRKYTLEEVAVLAHHDSCETTKGYCKSMDEDILNEMFGFKI